MSIYNQLRWALAHDPCRSTDRSPAGAVPAGTAVSVSIRLDETAMPFITAIDVLVLERGGYRDVSPGWHSVPLCLHGASYSGEIAFYEEPHVAFYIFTLKTVDDEVFYYVPSVDGRSTTGELVREPFDGVLTDAGWEYSAEKLGARPMGQFGLEGLAPGFQITVYDPSFAVPRWATGAIMYQIFPDRFAIGSGGVRSEGLKYHRYMNRPVRLHRAWNDPVDWKGDAVDSEDETLAAQMAAYDPVDFFGGTLEGIREKLSYLASLGVGVLYLNPVFEARSNHRYDTADYERIDPLLGTERDFRRLVDEAASFGISIMLDAVLSHTGDDSRYFNAKETYDNPGAMQGEMSPFYKWYDFAHPTEGAAYRCWWGYPTLPEVNEQDESWQNYMLGSQNDDCPGEGQGALGVLGAWLRAGVRGYRLDVADEIPDHVLEKIRESVKRANPEAVVLGEVWEDATSKVSYGAPRTYALGRSLDSVMNYPLRSALIGFALGTIDAHQFAAFLKQQKSNYPVPLYSILMNLLSTHDVERVRSVLAVGGPIKQLPRNEQLEVVRTIERDQDAAAARMQRMIVSLLYALPGMPCIYYGDERGLQGGGDPFCRATFPWEDRDDCGIDLTEFYERIGALRKASNVLRTGLFACVAPDSDVVCVFRYDSERKTAVVAAANRSDIPRRVAIDLFSPSLSLPSAAQNALRNALLIGSVQFSSEGNDGGIEHITCEGGIVHLTVPARSTTYWQAQR